MEYGLFSSPDRQSPFCGMVSGCFLGGNSNQCLYYKSVEDLGLSYIDITLLVAGISVFLHLLVVKPVELHSFWWIENLTLVACYLLVRSLSTNKYRMLWWVLIFVAAIQSSLGVLQFLDISKSLHSTFNVTGTFFNPAPYAGFLAALFPVVLGGWYFILRQRGANGNNMIKVYKYVLILNCFLIVFALFLAGSRAAWLSALVVLICMLLPCIPVLKKWIAGFFNVTSQIYFFNDLSKRVLLIVALILLIVGMSMGLYNLRPASVNGRLLIWKSTIQMIKDNLLTGVGVGQFSANYMNYQAGYLQSKPDLQESQLADNNVFAFNEYLRGISEMGITGLFLVLFIL